VSAFPPSIELTRLYERVSERGTRYLLGRLGAARIVLLPGDPTEDGTATWRLLLQERAQATGQDSPQPGRRQRAPRRRLRGARQEPVADLPLLNDGVDDLWPDHSRGAAG